MDRTHLSGFTLVELLITLSIFAILLVLSVVSFADLIRANRLGAQASLFVTAINLARTEAIVRNHRVIICARAEESCDEEDSWENGWIVFDDHDGNQEVDDNEIIRLFEPLPAGYMLQPNVRTKSLMFYGDGRARRGSGGLPLMTFRLCSPDAMEGSVEERAREVVVNAAGRMRLQNGREGKTVCP